MLFQPPPWPPALAGTAPQFDAARYIDRCGRRCYDASYTLAERLPSRAALRIGWEHDSTRHRDAMAPGEYNTTLVVPQPRTARDVLEYAETGANFPVAPPSG